VVFVERGAGLISVDGVEHRFSAAALCVSEVDVHVRGAALRGWILRTANRRAPGGAGGADVPSSTPVLPGVYPIGAVQRERCEVLFEALADELGNCGGADGPAVLPLVDLILLWSSRAAGSAPDRHGSAASSQRLAWQVLDVIDRRFAERLSLSDVAVELARSPASVARAVRVATGHSVVELITERRVQEACLLLSGSALPIGEIAASVGYPTLAYFHRVFRRARGTTPQRWRAGAR
jgi:AraC-like DNA-binding protein